MSLLPSRASLFDDLFRDLASGFTVKPLHGDPLPAQVKLDVKESDSLYTVLAELPGVRKEDIHLDIQGRVVTIRAEVRQHDSQEQEERLLRSERYYGSVARSFELPMDVTLDGVNARFDNGLLTLSLPKQSNPQSGQRIPIE
ncbi:Hsp20/alpha crystallin family protein [Aeromonas schubertii]|uniref:Small heat shock protein n=1 Tax=Aeromonas schubertii TaxID=652 RepID=A0A0S2SFN2_9GAMM|nr:Hsp20/alpha crystallin family protein [Aeromonas schubertii]ALP40519.1 small heat shock protein [Aeromonas schubertii]KUE81130.1 heat-shock protein Hsp20 [Aeromonas schubertii]MBZ6070861.1 Hsp20/alpha crystallin family protein [Aeromonas schubertii]QCG47259.1 Hsp20/alpha crystallin family protein [Aeromonas schubertii]